MRQQKKLFVTPEGLRKLQEELQNLKNVRRADIAAKLKRALEFGDLSENAEYQEAKEEQAMVEVRIVELEEQLKNVEIIEEKEDRISLDNVVQIGSTVSIQNITDDEEEVEEYMIVGSAETDPLNGKISNESPIGAELLEKKKGDIIKVKVPAGIHEYKILDIK